LKPWLEDIIEQLATAKFLMDGETKSGKRLALIIVDNSIEYMLKAYVEAHKRLVGKV